MPGRIRPTGRIGSKSIEIDASWIHWDDTQFDQGGIQCNLNEFLPKLTSIYLNEFTPKLTIIYLNGFTPNSTGQIWPVKLVVNPLRLWPPNLNEFLPKSTSIYLNEFTPKSTSIYLNGFTPNSTGRIGSKSIEIDASWIHWDDTQSDQEGIQWISTQFEQYFMPGQIWNSTRRIWPGINYSSNWVEIHWDYTII